jgi:hypothetical protein
MERIQKWRRRTELVKALESFWWHAKNRELKKYFLDHYKSFILNSVKEKNLDWSINWQLQFHSKSDWWTNWTRNKSANKYDLFYKKEKWDRALNENYEQELKKYDHIYEDRNLDLDNNNRKLYSRNLLIRDSKIVKELKEIYDNKCQICGERIEISKDIYYSEWHHIKPLGRDHNGDDIQENILVLCPNHHTQFDYWVIAINPINFQIEYKYQKGNNLKINKSHEVWIEYLKYHYDKIFKK